MAAEMLDTGIEEILARKAERVAAREERKKERADKGEVNKLILERNETGLYMVRYKAGGLPPESLRGYFTHKYKLLDMVRQHYGDTSIVEEA